MNRPSLLLSPFLFLPGLILEGIVRARNLMYSAGVFVQHSLPNPVISIGNLTLGGAGKTPLVIRVASLLREMGEFPALLSRGYGRSNMQESHVLPPGAQIPSPALNLGDEPALVRRRVPDLWLGISSNRYQVAGRIGERRRNVVFILDDGFQHRKLRRDLDVVVVDSAQPLSGNHVIPRGTLREPLRGLSRAHVVVINCGPSPTIASHLESLVCRIHPKAEIFHCRQEISSILPFHVWEEAGTASCPPVELESAFLVAAVGNPQRFLRDVEALGIRVKGTRFFRDHYRLAFQDWQSCVRAAREQKAHGILTTEKDAIKLTQAPGFPLLVAVQSTRILEFDEFRQLLRKTIEGAR